MQILKLYKASCLAQTTTKPTATPPIRVSRTQWKCTCRSIQVDYINAKHQIKGNGCHWMSRIEVRRAHLRFTSVEAGTTDKATGRFAEGCYGRSTTSRF